MNKVEAIFNEYVQNLYEAEYVDKESDRRIKYLACRNIMDANDIPQLEEKLASAFGKGVYKPKEFRKAAIADIKYLIFPGQTLYYGRAIENGKSVAYTVEICPWKPFDEKQKAKLKGHFPEEPVTVVFRKIGSDGSENTL